MIDTNNSDNGIGFLGVLGIVFITLKLLGVIHWSWWYVTLPFWGWPAFTLALWAICISIGWALRRW